MALCHRLFFALKPPVRELPKIGGHRDKLGEIRDKVGNRRLHLTLAITNDCDRYSADMARRLCAIADGIMAEPVPIALSRLTGSPDSVALAPSRSSPALRGLQASLETGMARAGLLRGNWTFRPHVTLGYREGTAFSRAIEPIRWENDDFVLIHSAVGETRHDELARWPLAWRQGRLF